MSVKSALQSELIPFIAEETKELVALGKAYSNGEVFKWYDREKGPATKHEHKREELNTAVKESVGGPARGLGKIVADRIASHERLLIARNETRLMCYVRAQVRAAQIKAALESLRDLTLQRVTS